MLDFCICMGASSSVFKGYYRMYHPGLHRRVRKYVTFMQLTTYSIPKKCAYWGRARAIGSIGPGPWGPLDGNVICHHGNAICRNITLA